MNRKGFTLIELIIVVLIVTILIFLVILVLNPKATINKAHDAQRKKDLEHLRIAFENYYADYSCYPTSEQIQNCDSSDLEPYLKKIPCDPSTEIPYELIAEPATCPQNFTFYAQLRYNPSSVSTADPNCFSVSSPNITPDPDRDCSRYTDTYVPPTGTPTGTPTQFIPPNTGTPPPVIPGQPYYYCSSLNNCTELPPDATCDPNFPWPDTNCSGACSDPVNICTPQFFTQTIEL